MAEKKKRIILKMKFRRFFIFNMVDECDIYKNMILWVKIDGYGNEKPSLMVFNFSKSAGGGFYFFFVRYTEIHGLFFSFSKIAIGDFCFLKKLLHSEKLPVVIFLKFTYFYNSSQNSIFWYKLF